MLKLRPTALFFTRISPSFGSPNSTSSHLRTSGPPSSWTLIALIIFLGAASASALTVCDALLARVAVNGSGFGVWREWKWEIFGFISTCNGNRWWYWWHWWHWHWWIPGLINPFFLISADYYFVFFFLFFFNIFSSECGRNRGNVTIMASLMVLIFKLYITLYFFNKINKNYLILLCQVMIWFPSTQKKKLWLVHDKKG